MTFSSYCHATNLNSHDFVITLRVSYQRFGCVINVRLFVFAVEYHLQTESNDTYLNVLQEAP